jgi:hypothetical protein
MLFTLWPRKRAPRSASEARRTSNPARRHATFRPRLEALEERWLPSTLTVTNTLDSGPGSLRAEIAAAQNGDTIVFNFGSKKANDTPHTITLTGGELVISKSLTIKGQGETIASQPYENGLLEPVYGSRIFEVDGAGTTVAISGLTLTNGGGTRYGFGATGNPYDGYGGAILNFGTLTLSGCTLGGSTPVGPWDLVGNQSANSGGAIANFGTMTVSGCNVSNNSADGAVVRSMPAAGGGGIYNAGTMTISGSYVQNNSAPDPGGEGGGILNLGTLTVSGSHVVSDSATSGGGIYNAETAAALTVLDSIFSGNSPDNIHGLYTDGGGNSFT